MTLEFETSSLALSALGAAGSLGETMTPANALEAVRTSSPSETVAGASTLEAGGSLGVENVCDLGETYGVASAVDAVGRLSSETVGASALEAGASVLQASALVVSAFGAVGSLAENTFGVKKKKQKKP